MAKQPQQQIADLYNELKIARDKACRDYPSRRDEVRAMFTIADSLRQSIHHIDCIASQDSHGELSVLELNGIHSAIWNDLQLFDSISEDASELFTWRDHPVEWRGKQFSNMVDAICSEAREYSWILLQCSSRVLLAPTRQHQELYPEPWFNVACAQEVARRVRDYRLIPKKPTPKVNAKGSQAEKMVSYLTKHHQYENGIVENYNPAKSADIAKEAGQISPSTVSNFLQREFKSSGSPREGYEQACRSGAKLLHWFMVQHGDSLPVRNADLGDYDESTIRKKW